MHAIVHSIKTAYFFHIFCNDNRSTIVNAVVCGLSTPAVTVSYIKIALRSLIQSQMCLLLYKYEKKKKRAESIKLVCLLNIYFHLNIKLPVP